MQALWKQNHQSDLEIDALRMQINMEDQNNIGERKEIEYLSDINKEKKELSDQMFRELTRLRAIDEDLQDTIDSTREVN